MDYALYATNLKINSMFFVNAHVTIFVESYISIKPYYVRKPSMDNLIQLLNTDNTIEMQKFAIFIKSVFIIINYVIFD